MSTTNLLQCENDSPLNSAVNLHRLSSIVNSEYNDSDDDIYRNNESDEPNEQQYNDMHKIHRGINTPYSKLKDYEEIEMNENAKTDKYWRQLLLYISYNSLRFLFIGIIILISNIHHQNDISTFKNGNDNMACCLCYNYAKFQDPTYRIDWSMCYESCHHCESCQNVETSNDECRIPHRIDTISDEQCPEKLSITSFGYSVKNYIIYGVAALICTILYIIFMIAAVIVNKENKSTSSAVIFIIANVQMSSICAYCMIKPYQYYLETYEYGTIQFQCYKDSLNEDIEDILSLLVYCAVALVMMPFFLYCFRCIVLRRDNYKIRKIYVIVVRFILIVASIGCILGAVSLSWISFKVAKKHKDGDGNKDLFHDGKILVISIDILMGLSLFDMCIFCEFCRDKIHTIYMVRYTPYVTHRDWELTVSENRSLQTDSKYN
eukprot:162225_1